MGGVSPESVMIGSSNECSGIKGKRLVATVRHFPQEKENARIVHLPKSTANELIKKSGGPLSVIGVHDEDATSRHPAAPGRPLCHVLVPVPGIGTIVCSSPFLEQGVVRLKSTGNVLREYQAKHDVLVLRGVNSSCAVCPPL